MTTTATQFAQNMLEALKRAEALFGDAGAAVEPDAADAYSQARIGDR